MKIPIKHTLRSNPKSEGDFPWAYSSSQFQRNSPVETMGFCSREDCPPPTLHIPIIVSVRVWQTGRPRKQVWPTGSHLLCVGFVLCPCTSENLFPSLLSSSSVSFIGSIFYFLLLGIQGPRSAEVRNTYVPTLRGSCSSHRRGQRQEAQYYVCSCRWERVWWGHQEDSPHLPCADGQQISATSPDLKWCPSIHVASVNWK